QPGDRMTIVAPAERSEMGVPTTPDFGAPAGAGLKSAAESAPQSGLQGGRNRIIERKRGIFERLRLAANWRQINGPLFRKYVALFLAVVFIVLLTNVA